MSIRLKDTANITAKSASSATSATKATQDSAGQQINTTYIKGLSVNGRTITYTKGDGSTGTITTQDTNTDTNTTYTLSKDGSTITLTGSDGKTTSVTDSNTTYSTGTTSTAGLTKLYTGVGTATDGTMTQAAMKTALDGKAASNHTHSYLPLSGGTLTSSIKFSGGGYNSHAIRMEAGDANGAFIGIGAGGLTVIGSGESTDAVRTALTNGADETMIVASDQTIRFLTGVQNGYSSAKEVSINTSGVINAPQGMTGNASTATKLQTVRTINGTNFDGSANITTANWGTARTLTIGSTGKSVNGSANVSWSLDEIGARPRIKKIIDLSNTTTYPVDKWYPCLATIPYDGMHDIEVAVQLNSGVKPSWSTHQSGFTCNLHVKAIAGGWGTTVADSIVLNHSYSFASANPCSYSQLNNSSNAVLWLRGGGKYFVFTDWNASWSVKTASTEISSQTVAPATSCPSISLTKSTMIANLSGNATTATTLQTTRTINGTNFNGSANITTANWGTARNIQIGNTAKSVNGSSNVSWSLSEIGALSLSGGTLTGLLSTPNNQMGIRLGDDVLIGDGNIANNMVLQGSQDSTLGGITFGSGKDTNIYRGGANLLKTDDTMNAVGGFQWNGQSLDNRYAAASHTHNYAGSSSAGGNANAAVKLATARSINGTNFDGTGNITTANWGTARTLTIGNTGKSVNGSGNVSWSLSEIGALPLTGGTLSGTLTANGRISAPTAGSSWISGMTVANATIGISTQQSENAYHPVLAVKTSGNHVANIGGIGNDFGFYGFKSGRTENGTDWSFKINAGTGAISSTGNITAPTFVGALSGNASTATTLQTARTINGTSFNGSANITTANWGTARNITIGNTAKSVNGSANVSWSLSEIGAAASNHTHGLVNLNSEAFSGGNDLNTYNSTKTWVARTLNSTTNKPADYFTVVNFGANSNSNFQLAHSYANNSTLYVRGRHDTSGNYTPWAKIYTDKNKPTASEIGAAAASHTHNYAGSSSAGGAANSATKLATARTIKVGNTGKTFDGSDGITFTLADIGIVSGTSAPNNDDGRPNGTVYFKYA